MQQKVPFLKKISIEATFAFLAVIAFIIFAGYMLTSVKKNSINEEFNHYIARFNDIDGITIGSDVKLAGYKVGSVETITIMPTSYDVKVHFSAPSNIQIPTDSTIAVRTSGLFGGKYLAILPGAEETYIQNGEEAIYTQGAMNLENLIGTFVNK